MLQPFNPLYKRADLILFDEEVREIIEIFTLARFHEVTAHLWVHLEFFAEHSENLNRRRPIGRGGHCQVLAADAQGHHTADRTRETAQR